MASSWVLKASLGIGGVAAASGAAIGIPKLLSEKGQLVSEIIKAKNSEKRLITSTSISDVAWKKAWLAYRTANKGAAIGKDTFKLSDWNGPISGDINADDNASSSLISVCSFNAKKKVLEGSRLYKDILDYCTRDTTIADLIKDSKKTALSKTSPNTSNEWKTAWERYRLANKDLSTDAWSASGFSDAKNNEGQNALDGFRDQCEAKLTSTSFRDKKLLEQVTSWCTVEGA